MKPTRLQMLAYNILIIIILMGLILLPRPAAGYLDVNKARHFDAAGDHAIAASAYALAAERLPWQPALWDKAGTAAQLSGNPADAILFLKSGCYPKCHFPIRLGIFRPSLPEYWEHFLGNKSLGTCPTVSQSLSLPGTRPA